MSYRGPMGGPLNAMRENGYNAGFARRPLAVPDRYTEEEAAAFRRGYRLGKEARARHDADVETSRS